MDFLDRVIKQKRAEIASKLERTPLEALTTIADDEPIRDFAAALRGGERIIAEVKKKSPKVARFHQAANVDTLAPVYEAAGAAAISVVTDTANFGTSLADAQRIRRTVSLPVLVKDFIFDPYQIHEARAFGADAVLLVSRILDRSRLRSLLDLAQALGMQALVEVHDENDLAQALDAAAPVIGINNRDLDTLTVSLDTTRRLVDRIAESAITVSESGIRERDDVIALSSLGVDAFLIGGALLEAHDPGGLLRKLLGDSSPGGTLRKAE